MPEAHFIRYLLQFKKPAGTSRGVLLEKESWFLILKDPKNPERIGIGECSIIPGLSIDYRRGIEPNMDEVCKALNKDLPLPDLTSFPAIQFAVESALKDYENGGNQIPFPSDFTDGKEGILMNGLIWMGDKRSMLEQVAEKLDLGFSVLKLKVGAIDIEEELSILQSIRKEHTEAELEIRLDANGAWKKDEAMEKLARLSAFRIHSIEQPIRAGSPMEMSELCLISPIPIALDEELIGIFGRAEKEKLLSSIKPGYIILKPSLLGGFRESEEWIELAKKAGIGWWITSALESNIGLNTIAQWTAMLRSDLPQGLGTGSLFENNIPSPLKTQGEKLFHLTNHSWDLSAIESYHS